MPDRSWFELQKELASDRKKFERTVNANKRTGNLRDLIGGLASLAALTGNPLLAGGIKLASTVAGETLLKDKKAKTDYFLKEDVREYNKGIGSSSIDRIAAGVIGSMGSAYAADKIGPDFMESLIKKIQSGRPDGLFSLPSFKPSEWYR